MSPLPWRELVRWGLLATIVLFALMLLDLSVRGNGNVLAFVQPGERGPAVAVFHEDFPDTELPDGIGHDGQLFYAIARQPMHPSEVAPDLDRPRYRLQRPLYPALAWLLHPTGGGTGLVSALFAVNLGAALLGAVALGALVSTLGGPAWSAALFPLVPGTLASVRISVADALAVALALVAIVAVLRGRTLLATVAAVAAVLTKEPVWLMVAGVAAAPALLRSRRRTAVVVLAPVVAAGLLFVGLRLGIDAEGSQVLEFTYPFGGVVQGWDQLTSNNVLAGVSLLSTLALAVVAIVRRGWRHVLVPAVAVHLAFVVVLAEDVVALNYNSTRAQLPLAALALAALLTPSPQRTLAGA